MWFIKKFIPNKGDYICFDDSIICSFLSQEYSATWPVFSDRRKFELENDFIIHNGELWTQCPVPIPFKETNWHRTR
jgi:hypothetical protein